jgi:hypothetical protein
MSGMSRFLSIQLLGLAVVAVAAACLGGCVEMSRTEPTWRGKTTGHNYRSDSAPLGSQHHVEE